MLPRKLQAGQVFKTATVNKINEIIDYLKTQRIVGDNKTLIVNQLTSGIGISVVQGATGKGSGGKPLDHPFKLSIVQEEDDPTIYLSITEGRIQVNDISQERCYVNFNEEYKIPLTNLEAGETYSVILMIQFDPTGAGDGLENFYFPCNVFFVPSSITTNLVPATRGIFTIPLGRFSVETIEEQTVYLIENQAVLSNMFLDFISMRHPFSITANTSSFNDGEVKKSYSLADFSFHVEEGSAIIGEKVVVVDSTDISISKKTWVYCEINEDTETATIVQKEEEIPYYDTENKVYNHLVGIIDFDKDYSGLIIEQKIYEEISSGADTYKLKVIKEDAQPDYLSGKLELQDGSEDNPISSYTEGFIGGDTPSSAVTEPGLSGTQYKFRPIWMWKEINEYDSKKEQVLTNEKGQLKWAPGYDIEITGSLADWVDLDEVSGTTYFRWKPEFDTKPDLDREPFFFMTSVDKKKNGIEKTQVLSGMSFGKNDEHKDGIMTWDFVSGFPGVTSPPPSSDTVSAWVYAGTQEEGLDWKPFTVSGNLILSGSLTNDFEIIDTTSGQVLRWIPEYDEERIPCNYLLGEDADTGEWMKWTWFPEDDEKGGIMIWNFPDDSFGIPSITVPPPKDEEVSAWVYAGSKEEGLSWVPYTSGNIELSGSIENLFELVEGDNGKNILRVVTEYEDLTEPQFYFVNLEADGSLSASTFFGESSEMGLDAPIIWSYEDGDIWTSITPDFNEEEHFVLAGNKEEGVYYVPLIEAITGEIAEMSGEFWKVAVDESDPSGDYLYYKLSSLSGSINIEIDHSEGIDTVNLEINPDYFYSSDESISIEPTEDGLDFTISSYLVQCTEDDLPEYLFDKITSEDGSLSASLAESGEGYQVSLIINPDYFYSSDESISIEKTEDGLDFTISSYLVQCTEGDLPEYLFDKITSEDGSLSASLAESGEGYQVSLIINPDYFFSSDESISIEPTEDGLDFTISSYLVQCTEGDLPQYLSDKITSASGSLIVDIGENGEGQTVNLEINPEYFTSSDESISIEPTENGLDFTISSYLVQCTEGDLPEYLSDKITSASGSLIVDIGENGEGQTVNLEINPEYFTSSDGTIGIEKTETGLDFTLSSAVVSVTEGDLPQYLSDKITSASGSLLVDIGENGEGQTVNLEINPEYFTSSDGTIGIEKTETGLDFTLSSAVVSVTEGDLPQFLSDKITSASGSLLVDIGENGEGQTVNLEINPSYFTSSDGTIGIEKTESGLDFTLSSAVVSVSEGDLPQFLSDKITSASGSLVVDIGENGEGQTVNLEINPEYFTSSDGTIGIEATESGLDFTLSSAVVSVSEGDLPQFLSDKITSEKESLLVEIGENGEGQTVNLEINPSYFTSSDGTIGIEPTETGLDFTLSSAVVSVTDGDLPQFLSDKITSEKESLLVTIGENGEGQTVNLEINPEYFTSSDESILIEPTETGLDLKDTCKSKVNEADEPGYLESKITVDPNIQSLITLENTGSQLVIKSAIQGSGLMKVENGVVTILTVPSSGNYLLAATNGTLSWVEYADVENACD